MIGDSPAMQEVYSMLGRLADTDATVLITGESGTGKELVAQAVHARGRAAQVRSWRSTAPRCPATLLESELFGHARGAFTDAKASRNGLFVQANGGTLFLDEIGEMPLGTQVKLLRALQERKVRPVGGDRECRSTRASCRRPAVTWRPRSPSSAFARISTTAST